MVSKRTGEILVVAEHHADQVKPVSLELAAFGRELAQAFGRTVTGVILANPSRPLAESFAQASGLPVLALENENLSCYNAEAYLQGLAMLARERKPDLILIAHTAVGWDFAPRLAVALGGSCSTGITGWKTGDTIKYYRAICGGKIITEVAPLADSVAIVTVMPGAFQPKAPEGAGAVELIKVKVDTAGTQTLGYQEAPPRSLDLAKAEVIVAAGRGIGGPEHLGLVRELAACFDRAAVGASRPVCDAGWLPLEHQVGMTGQTVAPKLYLACGISGAIQHTTGMSRAEVVVAVNTDPGAAIFNVAHLGIVQDLHRFLPVLIAKLRSNQRPFSG
jgi:electron transfer flavoprotein alpha subunit